MNSSTQTPVFLSRREMRAAAALRRCSGCRGSRRPDAARRAGCRPRAGPRDGIAVLFPLLGDVTSSTRSSDRARSAVEPSTRSSPPRARPTSESTLAMPVAEIEAELATPVPAYGRPAGADRADRRGRPLPRRPCREPALLRAVGDPACPAARLRRRRDPAAAHADRRISASQQPRRRHGTAAGSEPSPRAGRGRATDAAKR